MKRLLHLLIEGFASLKLTIVLLTFSMILVFFMTLDQVHLGIHGSLAKHIESVITVWQWPEQWGETRLPIALLLPGGYLLGGLLLINLLAAHITRFKLSLKKLGLQMIHLGIIILLVGEGITRFYAVETMMAIREGETQIYSYDQFDNELVFIDVTDPEVERVVAFPQRYLERNGVGRALISHDEIPVSFRVWWLYLNSDVGMASANPGMTPVPATRGLARETPMVAMEKEVTYALEEVNTVTALVEVYYGQESMGTWLVSNVFDGGPWPAQTLELDGRTYEMALRFRRDYKDFGIYLENFTFDRFPGTNRARDFRSRVELIDEGRWERREVEVFMNNPLRHAGYTFYQASFSEDEQGTIFMVVRNPAVVLPYIALILLTVGLIYHFMEHSLRRVKVVS